MTDNVSEYELRSPVMEQMAVMGHKHAA